MLRLNTGFRVDEFISRSDFFLSFCQKLTFSALVIFCWFLFKTVSAKNIQLFIRLFNDKIIYSCRDLKSKIVEVEIEKMQASTVKIMMMMMIYSETSSESAESRRRCREIDLLSGTGSKRGCPS